MVSQYGSKQGQNQRLKHTTSASAVSEMIVSMIVQVFRGDYSGQLTGSVTLTGFGTCGTWG